MARPHTLLTHVVADDRGLAMAPSDCPQYAVAIPASNRGRLRLRHRERPQLAAVLAVSRHEEQRRTGCAWALGTEGWDLGRCRRRGLYPRPSHRTSKARTRNQAWRIRRNSVVPTAKNVRQFEPLKMPVPPTFPSRFVPYSVPSVLQTLFPPQVKK
jgi:hypothetical protein